MSGIPVGKISDIRNAIRIPKPCNCDKKTTRQINCPVCDFDDPIKEPKFVYPSQWPYDAEVVSKHKEALAEVVSKDICPPDNLSGRGIIFVGEGKYWAGIVIAVRLLLEIGCKIPIQVWYNGAIGRELNDIPGVTLINARQFRKNHPARILGGWEIKTYAILHSGFKHVLYLDADAYCVTDPSPLFDLLDIYPFVYWADFDKQNVRWQYYAINGQHIPSVQGGQLFINLESFWRETMIAHFINMHSDYFYSHQFGDQDSWVVALAATAIKYYRIDRATWQDVAFRCIYKNKDYIVHRCQSKLFIGTNPRTSIYLPLENKVFNMFRSLIPMSTKEAFTKVYESGVWGNNFSSGSGSGELEGRPYIDFINEFIKTNNIKTVLDLGCGDGYILKNIQAESLTGVDVFTHHINRLKEEAPNINWMELDFVEKKEELPSADLLLTKDVWQHLPSSYLINFYNYVLEAKKWKYVILTGDNYQAALDTHLGGYRGLNITKSPLNKFPFIEIKKYLHKSCLLLN